MQNEHKIFPKALNTTTTKHNKKTQSFVMPPKPIKTNGTNGIKPKTKPKKKQHNNSLTLNQGNKNYKSSLNKTTTSANRSFKSNKTSKARSHLSRDYLIMN